MIFRYGTHKINITAKKREVFPTPAENISLLFNKYGSCQVIFYSEVGSSSVNIGLRAKTTRVLILHVMLNLSVALGKSPLHLNSLCIAWRYFCVQHIMQLL